MSHVDETQVAAYVDADASLRDSERQAIEAHISSCDACRALIDGARETRDVARSILSRSGPASIAPPAFEDLMAIARERAVKQPATGSRFAWTRGLAAAAVLVLAVSVGIFNRKAGPILNDGVSEETTGFADSAVRNATSEMEAATIRSAENGATNAAQSGVAAGGAADELASISGAPSRSGAAQPPTPTAPPQRRAVTEELREDDAAGAGGVARARAARPEAEAESGEGAAAQVAAPPPALAADQRQRFEPARSLADTPADQDEVAARRAITAGRVVGSAECQTARAILATIPVVLDCAPLRGIERDTIDATEVIRVTQTIDDRDVWLAIILDSLVTPELGTRAASAMLVNRSIVAGAIRAGASNRTPNTISVVVGGYRVWLTGFESEAELQRLATTLITAN